MGGKSLPKKETLVHQTAIVEDGAKIGDGSRIWHHAHVRRGARLGRNCVLGKGVYIGEGVRIGDNVKIENYVSVYKGVTIENSVFVGPHVTFTNDLHPRIERFEKWKVAETVVRKGTSIGAGSVILCGITLGRYCFVGAGSTVTQNVPDHALVYGNPAKVHGYVCFCGEILIDLQGKEPPMAATCEKCGKKIEIRPKSQRQEF
ncbi:MAG: N-acetyltransferase [Candidatus Bathyarchaeota archaeon]|nr:MAG: N-acetyltransferase [Candidatus Bathyarchaeota archaeon]